MNEEEIGEGEIREAIRRMRLGKAAGADISYGKELLVK